MLQKILIALDGSEIAERALPLASAFAIKLGASIEALTVVNPDEDSGEDAQKSNQRDGNRYVEEVAERLRSLGIEVTTRVVFGDPAQEISRVAIDSGTDLIIMSTRGRSGVVRGLLGSVTDRVLHVTRVPLLVVGPESAQAVQNGRGARIAQILIPLDGSGLAEQALPLAKAAATAFGVKLLLVRSVRYPSSYWSAGYEYMGDADAMLLQELEEDAKDYLAAAAERLKAEGYNVEVRVERGHPRPAINAIVSDMPGTLIIMTTHGSSGFGRWVLGSVADSLVRTSQAPVLVVRPQGAPVGPSETDPGNPATGEPTA